MAQGQLSIFPSSVPNVVRLIGLLGDDAFAGLVAAIRSPEAFDLGERRVAQLAERLEIGADEARAILGTLGYLYGQIHRRTVANVSDADIAAALRRDLLVDNGDNDDVQMSRLVSLLRRDATIDDTKSLLLLRAGFTPRATSFTWTVDLRPDMSEDGSGVSRLAPIVQFRIATESAGERPGSFLFQVDPRALDELGDAIRSARERLDTIRATPSLAKLITD